MYPLFKLHYYVTILCYVHLIYIHTILHSWKHPENLVQCHPLEVDVQGQQKPCCSPAVTCLLQPTFPPLQTGRVLPWTSIRLRQENSSQAVMMRRSCFGLLFLEAGGGGVGNGRFKTSCRCWGLVGIYGWLLMMMKNKKKKKKIYSEVAEGQIGEENALKRKLVTNHHFWCFMWFLFFWGGSRGFSCQFWLPKSCFFLADLTGVRGMIPSYSFQIPDLLSFFLSQESSSEWHSTTSEYRWVSRESIPHCHISLKFA